MGRKPESKGPQSKILSWLEPSTSNFPPFDGKPSQNEEIEKENRQKRSDPPLQQTDQSQKPLDPRPSVRRSSRLQTKIPTSLSIPDPHQTRQENRPRKKVKPTSRQNKRRSETTPVTAFFQMKSTELKEKKDDVQLIDISHSESEEIEELQEEDDDEEFIVVGVHPRKAAKAKEKTSRSKRGQNKAKKEVIDVDTIDITIEETSQKKKRKAPVSSFFLTPAEKRNMQSLKAQNDFLESIQKRKLEDREKHGGKPVNPFFTNVAASIARQKQMQHLEEADPLREPGKAWTALSFPDSVSIIKASRDMRKVEINLPPGCSFMPEGDGRNIVIVEDAYDYNTSPRHLDKERLNNLAFWVRIGNFHAADAAVQDDRVILIEDEEDIADLMAELSRTWNQPEDAVRQTYHSIQEMKAQRQTEISKRSYFVDKYSPLSLRHICGNNYAANLLYQWLKEWKAYNIGDSDGCSFDEQLYTCDYEDEEDDEPTMDLVKLFALNGPHGAGKSSTIHAIAAELGIKVIEISSNQCRSGKAVLRQIGEATKSGRVAASLQSFSAKAGDDDKQRGQKAKKKRRKDSSVMRATKDVRKAMKKRHEQYLQQKAHNLLCGKADSSLSLVLFEDIDVVFEEDKGFISALQSLIEDTKSPLITTSSKFPELLSRQAILYQDCARPSDNQYGLWIDCIARLEGISLQSQSIKRMADLLSCDLRRSLHHLQFWANYLPGNLRHDEELLVAVAMKGPYGLDILFSNYLKELDGRLELLEVPPLEVILPEEPPQDTPTQKKRRIQSHIDSSSDEEEFSGILLSVPKDVVTSAVEPKIKYKKDPSFRVTTEQRLEQMQHMETLTIISETLSFEDIYSCSESIQEEINISGDDALAQQIPDTLRHLSAETMIHRVGSGMHSMSISDAIEKALGDRNREEEQNQYPPIQQNLFEQYSKFKADGTIIATLDIPMIVRMSHLDKLNMCSKRTSRRYAPECKKLFDPELDLQL